MATATGPQNLKVQSMWPWQSGYPKEKSLVESFGCDNPEKAVEVASTCATESEHKVVPARASESWAADFATFDVSSFAPLNPGRFTFEHIIRPCTDGLHAQIEVHVDHFSGIKVVAKRFSRSYVKDSPSEFRQTSTEAEDPWTEMFVSQKLGKAPGRVRGVLPFHGIFLDGPDVLFMMEYASAGDVFELASSLGEPGPAREAQAAHVLCLLLESVKRLHCLGVAHCDISAENVILRMDGGELEVALLDFAMALHDTDLRFVTGGARGKLMYRAPEAIVDDAVYDARQADLFACGVVGYALAIGNYPWQSTSGGCKAFDYVKKNGVAAFFQKRTILRGSSKIPITNILSPEYHAVLVALLDLDPARRCDLSEILLKV